MRKAGAAEDLSSGRFRPHLSLAAERAFLATAALLFISSAWVTVYWCGSMSGGMAMPGGWTMSMAWMKMPGQAWLGAAAMFMGMWIVMMGVMMLPSLVPMLLIYHRPLRRTGGVRLGWLTAFAGAGYFLVWAVFGAVVYPLGIVLTTVEMRWPSFARSAPLATGIVLVLAGCLQLTKRKACQLRRCRAGASGGTSPDVRGAWRHGLQLGVDCSICCLGFMMIMLVAGVMELRIVIFLTGAITVERLASSATAVARAVGVAVIAAGGIVVANAMGLI